MAIDYAASIGGVSRLLDLELAELEDWNCCGATAAHSTDRQLSLALPARNLALAEAMGMDTVVATCSSCYLSLYQVEQHCQRNARTRAQVAEVLAAAGLKYSGQVRVRHMLDVLANDIGPAAIEARKKRTLNELKVVPYYGCQTVRPYMAYDAADQPMTMDIVLAALGAQVQPYPLKARCCSGINMTTAKDVGVKLVSDLLVAAEGADCIVTVCPLCQMNLDSYQRDVSRLLGREIKMPILFLTQLMGLVFDLPQGEVMINKSISSPQPVLDKLG